MKLLFISVGKANEALLKEAVSEYTSRIEHYMPAEWKIVDGEEAIMKVIMGKEGKTSGDYTIVLDERGIELTSPELSRRLARALNESVKRLIFVIGGAYGLSDTVKEKADAIISLSRMTFPHQITRLILVEQVYRACTILKNEKYHH